MESFLYCLSSNAGTLFSEKQSIFASAMSMEEIDQIIGEELGLRKKRNSIIEDLVSEEIRKIQKACKYSCSQ